MSMTKDDWTLLVGDFEDEFVAVNGTVYQARVRDQSSGRLCVSLVEGVPVAVVEGQGELAV